MGNHRDLPDFDTLLAMYREDPDSLEEIRSELTERLLDRVPDETRRRLEGLQFRINMELRRARTPQARCLKLSTMMHDSIVELNHCLHNPEEALRRHESRKHEASVLPLRPGRDKPH